METENVRKWLFILRIPLALVTVALFFTLYSRFLLDRNIQNLKTSLSILDKAAGVGQAEAALLLVDQTLVSQMAREELDLKTVATLQYTQSVLAGGQKQRPVEDTQAMLTVMEEEQTAEQSGFLRGLDGVVAGAQNFLRRTALLPRQTLGRAGSPQIDQPILAEAARLERLGLVSEAAVLYERLLTRYPNYSGLPTLKLRLGQLYQRMQDFRRATRLYQEAAQTARTSQELGIAQQMLAQAAQIQKLAAAVPALEKRLAKAAPGPDRQRMAAELGARLIEISEMDKAATAYREAVLAFPDGEKTLTYLFKEAWCLRSAGRLEEAFRKFTDLIRKEPKGAWAASSYQQMAEMYKATGNYEGATQAYEQAIAKGDDQMAAVVHAQAGSTYLYDLNDSAKAYAHYHDLEVLYPASTNSTTLKSIQDLHQEKKTELPSGPSPLIPSTVPGGTKPPLEDLNAGALTEGSPLMGWMEKFLPVFVDVFTGRLEKYLTATNQTQLRRQFTEAEFRDLVVREVQRRFPGQVSNVNAKIKSDGFVGSGTVRLGLLSFPVETKIGIVVIKERPHAVVREIKVAKMGLPAPLLKLLETRVNASIDQARYPLKVKEYTLKDGYALISVELAR